MPHLRARLLDAPLRKAIRWSPTVCLLGMRQIGKTTLLKSLAGSYLSLDDDSLLLRFQRSDWAALEAARAPTVLDECQKAPGLFDRIKLLVDQAPRPGRFVLTGSVRFLSKKHIRESLTGRTVIFELLPLTLAECHEQPERDTVGQLPRLLAAKEPLAALRKLARFSGRQCADYLDKGGMPGICLKRDVSARTQLYDQHLETLLSRDLQMLVATRVPYPKLRQLFGALCAQQGEPVNHSALARATGVSLPTLKSLIAGFEGLFLVRAVGKTYYIEDQGLASHAGAVAVESPDFHARRLVFAWLWSQLTYFHRGQATLSHHLSRGGLHLPFLFTFNTGVALAIMVDGETQSSEKSLKGLTWYRKRHPRAQALALHGGEEGYVSSAGIPCVPYRWLI